MNRRDLLRNRKSDAGFLIWLGFFCLKKKKIVFLFVLVGEVFCPFVFHLKLAVEENFIKSDLPPQLIYKKFITCHMPKPFLSLAEYKNPATSSL